MATHLVLVSATSTEMIFMGSMYKAPPLDRKRRKVSYVISLHWQIHTVIYVCIVSITYLLLQTHHTCIHTHTYTLWPHTEMAWTILYIESKSHTGVFQVKKSSRIKQVSETSHRSSWMYQSWDWIRVQELWTHSQLGNIQTDLLLCHSQRCPHAAVGQCAGEDKECTRW